MLHIAIDSKFIKKIFIFLEIQAFFYNILYL